MISTAPLSLDRADEQVEAMLHQGTAFARVEDVIDASLFSQRHKAALWLLAWSLRDPATQRREARLMAAAFAANQSVSAGHLGRRVTRKRPSLGAGFAMVNDRRRSRVARRSASAR